jgi:hypothetical protein
MRALIASLVLLAAVVYWEGDNSSWHPIFLEAWLAHFGISWMGHEHDPTYPRAEDGVIVDAPVTTCWNYDFLERHCDGPDHWKALLDGQRVGAYMGDESPISPKFAKACGYASETKFCVKDYVDDGEPVWLNTGHDLTKYSLEVGCVGVHFEQLPCSSVKDTIDSSG